MDERAPLNIDIAERQTQHKNIQLLGLRRKGKQHSNDIVNALHTYQCELPS
jgi:pyrimidine operon attenuation protein/uracil phosphoribosyltransferase